MATVDETTEDVIEVETEKRIRTLTEKSLDIYNEKVHSYKTKLEQAWELVRTELDSYVSCVKDLVCLTNLEKGIVWYFDKYLNICTDFSEFLTKAYTHDSLKEIDVHNAHVKKCKLYVDDVLGKIENDKKDLLRNGTLGSKAAKPAHSRLSYGSRSMSSRSSSHLVRSLAKVEMARARVKFAEEEASLRKQQAELVEQDELYKASLARKNAEIQADLELLKLKGEVAAAEAEAHALQSVQGSQIPDIFSSLRNPIVKSEHFDNHTDVACDYQTEVKTSQPTAMSRANVFGPPPVSINRTDKLQGGVSGLFPPDLVDKNVTIKKQTLDQSIMSDLTSFLLKKELLLSRLTKFDDRPEQYAVWKASFKSIMLELKVTQFEELDLLVKWLGLESSRQAASIRASNVNNPSRGLVLIWERLDDRYGCPELVESSLKDKLHKFPKLSNKDHKKLYELTDILAEIECTKSDVRYRQLLAYFDSSSGVSPIVSKLPFGIQEKWTSEAAKYKLTHGVPFPPFTFFVDFVRRMSKIKNDPSFMYENTKSSSDQPKRSDMFKSIVSRRTEVSVETDVSKRCPIHRAHHTLNACRVFKAKPYGERKRFLKEKHICFRCCASTKHVSRDCKTDVKCEHCDSDRHSSAMHVNVNSNRTSHGGEVSFPVDVATPKCTTLCGTGFNGRSCGKVLLVKVYPSGQPQKAHKVYALVDDQSNCSLASKELFDSLEVSTEPTPYTLTSCSGTITMYGRRANNVTIRSVNGSSSIEVPVLIECNDIPNNTSEIPTPEVARCYPHLERIAEHIPAFDPQLNIQLLLGRDVSEMHYVKEQIIGPKHTPFAQKLSLGWVIIGNVCLNGMHPPDSVHVNKITVKADGRGTIFEQCENFVSLKEHSVTNACNVESHDFKGEALFQKSSDDDKLGLSREDRQFLDLMNKEFHKDSKGCWTAPLPFRMPRKVMPNNRALAWRRALLLDASLKKDHTKKQHFVSFMHKVLESNAAEVALPTNSTACWYLPLFGVYHPRKPNQIRGVFDSSSVYEGVSLNSILMSGPVLTNSLLGVLLRFRLNKIAITADVEQMFYQFCVKEEHRDYLRFFWYEDNDPNKRLIEYRMRVHVFGNSPSPAVATYGLRKAVSNCDSDVKDFVYNNFYVDDGLTSMPCVASATDLLKRTQSALMSEGNIRLHKIASNSTKVMNAFPSDDLGKDLKDLCIDEDFLPLQRSLGLSWNLNCDQFIFDVNISGKPYTKRGLLSTVNSLYDPMGFIAPIVLSGKILLREATPPGSDWDEPLSTRHQIEWEKWLKSLQSLRNVAIPRMYVPLSLSDCDSYEVLIFADASEKAVAAAAYMKVTDNSNNSCLGFVMGKSKLAPLKGHTIPRLELCAAVLATEIGETVSEHLNVNPSAIKYFTDSKVVLGYIGNETRRFFTYVSNRVERIRKISSPKQWNFVPTDKNPADCGTRYSVSVIDINVSPWITGPVWICKGNEPVILNVDSFPLVEPHNDREIRPEMTVHKTSVSTCFNLKSSHFEKFSRWSSLVRTVSLLMHIAHSFKSSEGTCVGWHLCSTYKNPKCYKDAEIFIIKNTQRECFSDEISQLSKGKDLPKDSSILKLSPFLDCNGVLRVGGRLNKVKGQDTELEVNPIILPKNHHISIILIRHFHESIKHQGRQFSEGALRNAGYWVIGAKRTISSMIHGCVICRRLRRGLEHQKMADLPTDRITPGPPFTSVGVDTFGPWEVVARRTRGGVAESKRWAILFTCLTTRAVHIEVVQDMSSSSFINALRRFISLRGPVKLFRSDRGTNFIGAVDDMKINAVNVEDGPIRKFLYDSGTSWIFNAPHSSHMGGVWERMIGIARRILDSILLDNKRKDLTHETLTTFMAEVCAILNSRPIAQISSDPESPLILSPSMLLTGKLDNIPVIADSFNLKDIYRAQWKHVQFLSNMFWKRWKRDYFQSLQARRKWYLSCTNLKVGDIVLLRDKSASRIYWPLGIITETLESEDKVVRKVKVRVCKDGKSTDYIRPVNEMVLLIE